MCIKGLIFEIFYLNKNDLINQNTQYSKTENLQNFT